MIERTIWAQIQYSLQNRPITLITGARQVGKTTICHRIADEYHYSYVSLDDLRERETAINDPEMFIELHPAPCIIDEVQYAPRLFDVIESIVNARKYSGKSNYGMFVLTGSQSYQLMEKVSESMAGRVAIITMSCLSLSEINGMAEEPFTVDLKKCQNRTAEYSISVTQMYQKIVRGFYPELYDNKKIKTEQFYADYVSTYMERDVSKLINIKDKIQFQNFLELLASLTGEELVYDSIAKAVGVSIKTVKSWISVLVAGHIVYLLQPYNELSVAKRIVKRPKIYFEDTGLACWLARLTDEEVLKKSIFNGRFAETYIINEIRKSFRNNGMNPRFNYYRDTNQNEIDLVMNVNGVLHLVECKTGIAFNEKAVSSFKQLEKSQYEIGQSCIVCNTKTIYPIAKGVVALPLASI